MASKVMPALLLLGFLVVMMLSFHPTPSQSVSPYVVVPQTQSAQSTQSDTNQSLKRYWMVFLKKGPLRNQDSITAARIQHAHLAGINHLVAAGKLVIAGPFENDNDFLGIFIMDCPDSLEAAGLVSKDPAVAAGRLIFEIRPWWTKKNCLFK
jgi:uncharacterized protein YciI